MFNSWKVSFKNDVTSMVPTRVGDPGASIAPRRASVTVAFNRSPTFR